MPPAARIGLGGMVFHAFNRANARARIFANEVGEKGDKSNY
jgi:hypothetical protein